MTRESQAEGKKQAQVMSLVERRLLNEGLPILEQVIRKVLVRVGGRIDRDDLRSMGHEALVRLIRRYDPSKSPLSAFLRTRLLYALLDGIRHESHSRLVVARARAFRASQKVAEAREEERSELNASRALSGLSHTDELPTEEDYKAQLQLLMREQAAALGVSLMAARGKETAKADSSNNPEKAVLRATAAHELRAAVTALKDERQRVLIERHYFGGETFEAIAADMGISKGWASRLHARAVRTLGKQLRGPSNGVAADDGTSHDTTANETNPRGSDSSRGVTSLG